MRRLIPRECFRDLLRDPFPHLINVDRFSVQLGHRLVHCKCLLMTHGHWQFFTVMSSRFNRFWLPVLRLSETRSETRTRLIKVVPKNEKEIGVPHWNGTRYPINVH
jgi:hypothetical protein